VSSDLRRVLGPFDATCVVIGAIIGVGIFFTPTSVARIAGSGELALIAWAVGGLIALGGALTFAELGLRYPTTAGQYQIIRDCAGRYAAFLFVICAATIIVPGAAAIIAILCAQNLAFALTGSAPQAAAAIVPAALLTAGLTLINAWGTKWGAGIQNATVIAKVAAILAIVVLAIFAVGPGPFGPSAPDSAGRLPATPLAAICAALVPAFFSYGGWQQVLWVGGEVREPRRTLPRAIIVGVVLVVAIYLLVNWAYLYLLGPAGVAASSALAADAVATIWPVGAARVVAGAVAVSALGVLNVQFLSGPRLIHGLAEDGQLPRVLARVHATRGTPIPAIALLGAVTLAILAVAGIFGQRPIDQLTTGVVFVDCIFFVITGAALFVLRRREPGAPRLLGRVLFPAAPIIFIIGEAGMLVGAFLDAPTRSASLIGAAWVAAITVWWVLARR